MSNFVKAVTAKKLTKCSTAPETTVFEDMYVFLTSEISRRIRDAAKDGLDHTTIVLYDGDINSLDFGDLNDFLRANGYSAWFSLWLTNDPDEESDDEWIVETDKFDDAIYNEIRAYMYFTANIVISWE